MGDDTGHAQDFDMDVVRIVLNRKGSEINQFVIYKRIRWWIGVDQFHIKLDLIFP